jgi:hypothetical protein
MDEPILRSGMGEASEHGRIGSNGRMNRKRNVAICRGVRDVLWFFHL